LPKSLVVGCPRVADMGKPRVNLGASALYVADRVGYPQDGR
jgi:hypothetical protein